MSIIETKFNTLKTTPSDINEHLPTLYTYATKCNSVVECGVRTVVSSYAFANALKGRRDTKLTLVDPSKSNNVEEFLNECSESKLDASFLNQSDLDCPLLHTDLLFIDTWHVYGQLKRELSRWNSYVYKYIIMHDTTIDEWKGETIRVGWNPEEQSKEFNIPVDEITKGLWPAIDEFLQVHPEWKLKERFTNNNGLTILERF
jgi:hypothetical protein